MGETLAEQFRRIMDACPECGRPVEVWERICFGPNQGNTYHCAWCSWSGRSPKIVLRCDNEWPDYKPRWPLEPPHPLACACTGRGYFDPDDVSEGGECDGTDS